MKPVNKSLIMFLIAHQSRLTCCCVVADGGSDTSERAYSKYVAPQLNNKMDRTAPQITVAKGTRI